MIEGVILNNWMSFENEEATFTNLNVFSGENCSGKSNMLKSFLFAQLTSFGTIYMDVKDFFNCENIADELSVEIKFTDDLKVNVSWERVKDYEFKINGLERNEKILTEPLFNEKFHHVRIGDRIDCNKNLFEDIVKQSEIFKNKIEDIDRFIKKFQSFGESYEIIIPTLKSIFLAKEGDLLIIEHPENNLHPKFCSLLGRMFAILAEAGVQLFIETHSDHVINGIRVAVKQKVITTDKVSFHFFRRLGSKSMVKEIVVDETGEFSEYPTGFFDQWCDDLTKLIS